MADTQQDTQYDKQIETYVDSATQKDYVEVIVDGDQRIELFSQGGPNALSLQMTSRQARTLAQALLAAADIADDNRDA